MGTNRLLTELRETLSRIDMLKLPIQGVDATIHEKSGIIELIYTTLEHQLPESYFALNRQITEQASEHVLIRVIQPQHCETLLADSQLLTQCVRDCCSLLEPIVSPFVTRCEVSKAASHRIILTVSDAMGVKLFEHMTLPDRLVRYFQDVYGETLEVRIRQGHEESVQDPSKAPEASIRISASSNLVSPKKVVVSEAAPSVAIADLQIDSEQRVVLDAQIITHEALERKNGELKVHKYTLCDGTGSLLAVYLESSRSRRRLEIPPEGQWVRFTGTYEHDRFERQNVFRIRNVEPTQHIERQDNADSKRVELHAHTKMSAMDAVTDIGSLIRKAAAWGHSAVAITDHGVGQAFPIAAGIAQQEDIKIIYGVEGYMFDDERCIFTGLAGSLPVEVVVLDFKATGSSPLNAEVLELFAARVLNGKVTERFRTLVRPQGTLDLQLFNDGIDEKQLRKAPLASEARVLLQDFIREAPVAGVDGLTTLYFLSSALNCNFEHGIVDLELLLRAVWPDLSSFKLKSVVQALHLPLSAEDHPVLLAAQLLIAGLEMLIEEGCTDVAAAEMRLSPKVLFRGAKTYHIILLCRDKAGMVALNRLISASHVDFLDRKKPRMPKSLIRKYREHLLIGSACESGDLYQALVEGAPESRLEKVAAFYDYLEIQPLGNNQFMVRDGLVKDKECLKDCNRRIVALGAKLGLPVAATCDVHFLNPEDECHRRLLQHGMGFDAAPQPPLYFRTTEEMITEFEYLGPEKAQEVVVKVPSALADKVERFPLLPDETVMPMIDGADERIEKMAYENARRIYGQALPEIVSARLARELDSIIRHGFSVLYYSAHLLVKKSNEDGYMVGSRGSVGSSFAATMTGITEVNPLPPHYICPTCQYSDFNVDVTRYDVGPDLPDAICPRCGSLLSKEGFNIPFEVFLGIDADKVPDIDLNFSGEYQNRAHAYTEEIFGRGHVFRAGTIMSLKDKNAMGYVRKYLEDTHTEVCNAEFTRLYKGLENVKKSSGKHPGGMVIVPRDREIYEFTAVQWPANKPEDGFVTTHYGFDSMHDILVKLDILGHDGPTIMKLIKDITGLEPLEIPLADPEVLRLFSSIEPLGIEPAALFDISVGTLGIPEFGTPFVREMLAETQPRTVAEIVRISGLSHGTDVWLDNAQDLIRNGTVTLSEAICARDDIMNFLVAKGVDKRQAFFIMEDTRKGKVAKQGFSDQATKALSEAKVPDWFIEACRKIKYMFPKGHAVAYTLLSLRIAYCKLYYKEAFYATFFDVHVDDFSCDLAAGGLAGMRQRCGRILAEGNNATEADRRAAYLLQLACEMYLRGIQFLPVDLYKSDPIRFLVEEDGLRMPFVSIPQLGEKVAFSIAAEREQGRFLSVKDLEQRARVSSAVTGMMRELGILRGMAETNQLSIFDQSA